LIDKTNVLFSFRVSFSEEHFSMIPDDALVREFFKIKVPLQSFGGQNVLAGQWQWPISFVLPVSKIVGACLYQGMSSDQAYHICDRAKQA
jgi:hypothetical protein